MSEVSNIGDYRSTGAIDFWVKTNSPKPEVILSLRDDGEIFVRGKPVERDKDVVDAMRDFLQKAGYAV